MTRDPALAATAARSIEPSAATERADQLLALHRLCVEKVDELSARRAQSNNNYIAMMGTAVVVYSGAPQYLQEGHFALVLQLLVSFGCVLLAIMWHLTIRSYRDLSIAKFRVILSLEDGLAAQPFQSEWKYLLESRANSRIVSRDLTWVELKLPMIVGAVAAYGFVYSAYAMIRKVWPLL